MYGASDTKAIIWELVSKHVAANINPIIVQMALDEGHGVVFSPPHHSDLQPIEIVWAVVKGKVGRHYTTDTNFKYFFGRLRDAFNELQSSTVAGCIRNANKHLDELWEHIRIIDELDEEEYEENGYQSSSSESDEQID